MVYDLVFFYTAFAVGILTLYNILKRANGWYYSLKFSSKTYIIPPGEMGWPYIGNMLFFIKSSVAGDGSSFLSYFMTRFGSGGMYKGYMFGKPSIIVTAPEVIKKILMDDENLSRGLPKYMSNLIGLTTSSQEDKQIRRIVAPIGHGLLSYYFDCINEVMKTSFEKWSAMEEPIKFLSEMEKPACEVFLRVLTGGEVAQEFIDVMFKEINFLISGVKGLPFNIPGFAYNKALEARKTLVKIYQEILDERKTMKLAKNKAMPNSNIIDMLLETQNDDNEDKGLSDDKIIRMLLLFSFAGFEPVAATATKAILHLEKHPELLQIAKEEQEEIVKRRPSSNTGLNFEEIKQMKYVSKVINETLRIAASRGTFFLRDTKNTVNINGYSIPKGWKFFVMLWNIHMDPNTYEKPKEFNPSRWDDLEVKPASFLPFGIGPRMCPGSNLAKLEISVILHYFLLNYRLEKVNPEKRTFPPENCLVRFKKLSASHE